MRVSVCVYNCIRIYTFHSREQLSCVCVCFPLQRQNKNVLFLTHWTTGVGLCCLMCSSYFVISRKKKQQRNRMKYWRRVLLLLLLVHFCTASNCIAILWCLTMIQCSWMKINEIHPGNRCYHSLLYTQYMYLWYNQTIS